MSYNVCSLIAGLFASTLSYAQTVPCENLTEKLRADTARYLLSYATSFSPDTCYCLAKYFAQRDIEEQVFLLQTYGNPEWANPCRVCKYENYGYQFIYHGDIVMDNKTRFIEGYNEVSKAHLQKQIGDSAFAHLDDIPDGYFDPRAVLRKNLETQNSRGIFIVDKINDTLINVRLNADILLKENPAFAPHVVYHIWEFDYKEKKREKTHTLDYSQFKETGVRLKERANNKYFLNISFDFSALANHEKICWCDFMDRWGMSSYVVPLTVE